MNNNCPPDRLNTSDYITPYYGPLVPCNAVECDPCNPAFWPQQVNETYLGPQESNQIEKSNIVNGAWSTAYGWHGDLNLRTYQYQFFDAMIQPPASQNYWPRPPGTDPNYCPNKTPINNK